MVLLASLGSAFRIVNHLEQPSNSYESSDSETYSVLDLRAITIPHVPTPSSLMQVHVLQLGISFGSHPWRLESLQSLAELLPSLHLAVLWFRSDFSLMKVAVDANPTLCEPLSSTRNITYRFLCKRSKEHPLAEVSKVYDDLFEVVEIDPITMEPTGIFLTRFHSSVLTSRYIRSGLGMGLYVWNHRTNGQLLSPRAHTVNYGFYGPTKPPLGLSVDHGVHFLTLTPSCIFTPSQPFSTGSLRWILMAWRNLTMPLQAYTWKYTIAAPTRSHADTLPVVSSTHLTRYMVSISS